jgi:hypothetical protein
LQSFCAKDLLELTNAIHSNVVNLHSDAPLRHELLNFAVVWSETRQYKINSWIIVEKLSHGESWFLATAGGYTMNELNETHVSLVA